MDDQELEFQDPNVIPSTALMTPIDQMALELAPIDAGLVEPPMSMGAETGLLQTPNQVMPAVTPEIGAQEFANAADILDPFNASTIEQVKNMVGAQYPTDIHTGQPLPPAPQPDMAAMGGQAVIAPEQQTMTQKVGETATSTVAPTTGMNAALQGARAGVQMVDDAAVAQIDIAQALAEDKAVIDAERQLVASQYAGRAEELYRQAEMDMQSSRDEIAKLRQQYASQPWQSYWGSKDAGDKIMLGLAVGLGALSQSQIGGQNLAMAFIQSSIDDHNKTQDMRFKNLEAQLSAAQTGSVQAQQGIKMQFENLIASKAAAYDHLDKALAAISAKTNVESARVNAEKLRGELSMKNNKELFDMEKELAARTTTRMDIFNTRTVKGDPRTFVRADGQPMTEAQSKEYKLVLGAAPAIRDMEELERQGIANTQAFSDYSKALIGEFRQLGAIGGMVDGALLLAKFDSAANRAIAGNSGLQLYNRALRKVMVDKLRLDSGASIAATEYLPFVQTYIPSDLTINVSPADQALNLKQAQDYRRLFLEGSLGASGSANKLWYMGGK